MRKTLKRMKRVASKPKPKASPLASKLSAMKPVAKAKAPGKFVNPYKPKAPITLPPGTKFKPIPPGVRKGPVGGGKPQIRPSVKPKVKPRVKPRRRVRPAARKVTRRRRA